MASGLSLELKKIRPHFRLKPSDGTARISGKDRSLAGKKRVRARREKQRAGRW